MSEERKTDVGGLRAVELSYRGIKDISSGNVQFYQTQMRLNTPNLGVLMPDRYIPVTECTDQCIKLFKLGYAQLLQTIKKFEQRDIEFEWVSIYLPVRFLVRADCVHFISEFTKKLGGTPSRICFELSGALLTESDGLAENSIKALRHLDYHVMLTDFGGANCPIVNVSRFSPDYVMLDGVLSDMLKEDEKQKICVKYLIKMLNELGVEPIADNVTAESQTLTLFEYECSYFAGAEAGKYMADRYVRRKSSN